jgi:hypothetical protein
MASGLSLLRRTEVGRRDGRAVSNLRKLSSGGYHYPDRRPSEFRYQRRRGIGALPTRAVLLGYAWALSGARGTCRLRGVLFPT